MSRGRPPRAEAPGLHVGVRLSPREKARAAEAAERNHQPLGHFIRDAILEAVDDTLEPLPSEPSRRLR